MINPGAEENFLDSCFVAQWGLSTIELKTPMVANMLNGQRLANIIQASVPVGLCLSGNHHEQVSFYVIIFPHAPLVLGHPWLAKHNPHIDWRGKRIVGRSPFCLSNCLLHAQTLLSLAPGSSEVFPDLSFPLSIWISRPFLVNPEPLRNPLIAPMTVALTSYLARLPLEVASILYHGLKQRP